MKTVFIGINGYDYPYVRVRCYHFAREVQKYGVEASVLSFRDKFAPHLSGIEMLTLGDLRKITLNLRAFLSLVSEGDALFYIQKVHYHSAAPYFLSRLTGKRFILDYDDWDLDRSPLFNRGFLNNLFFRANGSADVTAKMASDAVACVASSTFLYDYLLQYNKKVFHIPTGVDTERFKTKGIRKDDGVIKMIWTGNIWGRIIYDNVMFLLRCFSRIGTGGKKVSMRIVATGDFYGKVKKDAAALRFPGEVEFSDWVTPDEMNKILEDSHIGLLPLISDSENETWMKSKSPTKLFEYMAMELPAVSSDFGEASVIIKDGVNGFLAGSEDEFVEKLNTLIKDDNLREKAGINARRDVEEKYSLLVLGKRLSEILNQFGR